MNDGSPRARSLLYSASLFKAYIKISILLSLPYVLLMAMVEKIGESI